MVRLKGDVDDAGTAPKRCGGAESTEDDDDLRMWSRTAAARWGSTIGESNKPPVCDINKPRITIYAPSSLK